ncbi:LysR family transcriptional regulator [Aliidongia dinghuensis]|uniref:LysR family transcriptional regulator n=1 Tax=Aliidongia dinghuensis TaxID=1867774 RepID=A0A8J2Z1E5_9PROT|nr:LysR substrate-binding domain-containing protein [Aliidongia dinghuensis]GGF50018.1 LysR family transcriptional regulator [Aliidongia dinghuensis]
MPFDLTDLRLFLHVVEAASITRGAAAANMALASASERIRHLEDRLAVRLFDRGRRGVEPTPAGRAFAHHARLMLQQMERMRGEMADYARGLKGHVRLLANTAAAIEFLPEALAGFLAQHPHIDIDLEERPSHQIVDDVAEGLADAGVLADIVDPGELETHPLAIDRQVLVVPPDHPLAGETGIAFRDALALEFVGLGAGSALQQHLMQQAARLGRPLAFRVRVGSFEAICRLVEAGVGCGILSESAARRYRRSMAIRIVPLTDDWATRTLKLCLRRDAALPAHARQLIQHLRASSL